MMDFQELMEKCFGAIAETQDKKQFPNFVIKGTKLVFEYSDEKSKDS